MTFNQSDFQFNHVIALYFNIMHTFVCIKNLVHTFSETIIEITFEEFSRCDYLAGPLPTVVPLHQEKSTKATACALNGSHQTDYSLQKNA